MDEPAPEAFFWSWWEEDFGHTHFGFGAVGPTLLLMQPYIRVCKDRSHCSPRVWFRVLDPELSLSRLAIRMALASCTFDGCGGGAPAAATEVSGTAAGDLTSFEERAGGEGSLGSLDPPLHPPHHFFLA